MKDIFGALKIILEDVVIWVFHHFFAYQTRQHILFRY